MGFTVVNTSKHSWWPFLVNLLGQESELVKYPYYPLNILELLSKYPRLPKCLYLSCLTVLRSFIHPWAFELLTSSQDHFWCSLAFTSVFLWCLYVACGSLAILPKPEPTKKFRFGSDLDLGMCINTDLVSNVTNWHKISN